ncbi:MAG: thiamine phosphate synthase [Desulfobacteraceae bacterium]|nr:MAG: thiamine phosphate synthase [Desulfobacteraceae bacterium]
MIEAQKTKPVLPQGIYGITAEKFSRGRSNIEVVQAMIAGGIKIIQYREKRPDKSHRQMLSECRRIRDLTRAAGVLFIVNDYVDIALLAEADGVHVGQDDLPVADVRRLLGPHKLIGLSTHAIAQARQAVAEGADYIGVGPIFATLTKEDVVDPVGLEYLHTAVRDIDLPIAAIGGIKAHNIAEVARHGAKTICLVTEIVEAEDIAARVRSLSEAIRV